MIIHAGCLVLPTDDDFALAAEACPSAAVLESDGESDATASLSGEPPSASALSFASPRLLAFILRDDGVDGDLDDDEPAILPPGKKSAVFSSFGTSNACLSVSRPSEVELDTAAFLASPDIEFLPASSCSSGRCTVDLAVAMLDDLADDAASPADIAVTTVVLTRTSE